MTVDRPIYVLPLVCLLTSEGVNTSVREIFGEHCIVYGGAIETDGATPEIVH